VAVAGVGRSVGILILFLLFFSFGRYKNARKSGFTMRKEETEENFKGLTLRAGREFAGMNACAVGRAQHVVREFH
jgi:hypothetical protein